LVRPVTLTASGCSFFERGGVTVQKVDGNAAAEKWRGG
jgi:hypothetical protein